MSPVLNVKVDQRSVDFKGWRGGWGGVVCSSHACVGLKISDAALLLATHYGCHSLHLKDASVSCQTTAVSTFNPAQLANTLQYIGGYTRIE